jgi:hypothetical protein
MQYSASKGSFVTGVKLNRTFFAIKNKRNKEIVSKNLNTEDDYCKKHCGEKLFKNLDLSQRYYLKRSNVPKLHSEKCPIYLRENLQSRCSYLPSSHKEKRRLNTLKNKDDSHLNISISKSVNNGVLDMSDNTHKVK